MIADEEWASLPCNALFLGRMEKQNQAPMGCAIVGGLIADPGTFPGLKLIRDVKIDDQQTLEDVATYIPWRYILAVFSAPKWQTAFPRKEFGFAREIETLLGRA